MKDHFRPIDTAPIDTFNSCIKRLTRVDDHGKIVRFCQRQLPLKNNALQRSNTLRFRGIFRHIMLVESDFSDSNGFRVPAKISGKLVQLFFPILPDISRVETDGINDFSRKPFCEIFVNIPIIGIRSRAHKAPDSGKFRARNHVLKFSGPDKRIQMTMRVDQHYIKD